MWLYANSLFVNDKGEEIIGHQSSINAGGVYCVISDIYVFSHQWCRGRISCHHQKGENVESLIFDVLMITT